MIFLRVVSYCWILLCILMPCPVIDYVKPCTSCQERGYIGLNISLWYFSNNEIDHLEIMSIYQMVLYAPILCVSFPSRLLKVNFSIYSHVKFDKHVRRYDCLFVLIKRMQKRLQKENAMLWQIDFEKHLCCKYCIICRPNISISMSEHEVTSPYEQIYSYSWIDIIHKFIYLHRFF